MLVLNLLKINVAKSLDFQFDLLKMLVEMLDEAVCFGCVDRPLHEVGADLHSGNGIVELVAHRDNEFADCLRFVLCDRHAFFHSPQLFAHLHPLDHIDDVARQG